MYACAPSATESAQLQVETEALLKLLVTPAANSIRVNRSSALGIAQSQLVHDLQQGTRYTICPTFNHHSSNASHTTTEFGQACSEVAA